MKIIIGLGNPGLKYKLTRHNLGKEVIEKWQKKAGFPDFKLKKKLKTLSSEVKFNRQKVILALPETFMNNSGKAAKALIKFYKLNRKDLILIHDDIDIPLGKIRIAKGKGTAGHKGVQSVIDEIKTKDFIRLRLGIKPKNISTIRNLDGFVLKKFTNKEKKIIEKTTKDSIKALESLLSKGLEKTMNEFNK